MSCKSCSQRVEFGFRPKGTFYSLDKSKDVCTCIIDKRRIVLEFIRWCKCYGLAKDIPETDLPSFDNIIYILGRMSKYEIIRNLYQNAAVEPIGRYVEDAVYDLLDIDRIRIWNYLDVGCGNMVLTKNIANRMFFMPQGIDIIDRRLIKNQDSKEFTHFELFDGKNIDYEKESFMIITCFKLLHHIPNPKDLLESIYTVMAPGGILVIQEHDCTSWERMYSLDYMHRAMSIILDKEPAVTTYRSRQGWIDLIQNTGFNLLEGYTWKSMDVYKTFLEVFQKPQEFDTSNSLCYSDEYSPDYSEYDESFSKYSEDEYTEIEEFKENDLKND